MSEVKVYFSDFFEVNEEDIESYGAVNISLINDLPLFIDPFLLFNSEKEEYQKMHKGIIEYLIFLQDQSKNSLKLDSGMKKAWFMFSEVKQNWLGFSLSGNLGRGMGNEFAVGLYKGLKTIFKDFSEEGITQSRHMEKLCLISPRVGRDKISDFTANFAKEYLLEYTQEFAKKTISDKFCRTINVPRVYFNWTTNTWASKEFYLPYYNNDYVLLTPKDILTRDETFINRKDMLRRLDNILPSLQDDELRFELEQYFQNSLSSKCKQSRKERDDYISNMISNHPSIIDCYLKYKEDHREEATSVSKEKVQETEEIFNKNASALIELLNHLTSFYKCNPDVYMEAIKRVGYLKHVIEDQDGYRFFYFNGKPIIREEYLQIMFRLAWYGTTYAVDREVNNGRGPVDFKISHGKENAVLVEFKLASNSKLRHNMAKQTEVYKKASDTKRAIIVVLLFSEEEEKKTINIINELSLGGREDIVLIDARNDNKVSASNVKL